MREREGRIERENETRRKMRSVGETEGEIMKGERERGRERKRERKGKRKNERKKARDKYKERDCMCLCVGEK